jgi:hypothetical protein
MDVVGWTPVITAIIGLFSLAVSGYIGIKMAQIKANTQEAATDAHAAKTTLAKNTADTKSQLNDIAEVGVATHTLVNSNMGVQLKLNAALARRMASITGNQDDLRAAELAEALYQEHINKQAVVDKVKEKKEKSDGS